MNIAAYLCRSLAMTALVAFVSTLGPLQAQTLLGSNVDSRVLIGFKVDDDDLQPLMPEGWSSIGFPKGPLAGANVLMVLEDRKLARDAEGKPAAPLTSRATAFLSLGKETGGEGVRLFVLRVYTTNPDYDLFPDAQTADVAHKTLTEGPANGARQRMEDWNIVPEAGGEIAVSLSFDSGKRNWVTDKARPYSAADAEVSRIFHYDQLVDLVMSVPAGKPMAGAFSLSSTVPELAGIFDGSEELVAILDVPVYVREVFLP